MWRHAPLVVAFAFALVISPAFAGEPSPRELTDRVINTQLPGRDPVDLAIRLRGVSPETAVARPTPGAALASGDTHSFWILNQRNAQLFQADAIVRLVTEHAYWFVQADFADRAPQPDLERSARTFESTIYPVVRRYFGAESSPSRDGDPRVVFLLGNVPGVAAYFSSADAYPRAVNPRSNERSMIYVNLNSLRPGQMAFDSTIAHEFQHLLQFAHCPNQEGWVDEGASELAMRIAGYDAPPPTAFITHPDVQLNGWTTHPAELARHYQAAYLFLRYVAERAGGWDALPRVFETCARGELLFQQFLARQPIAPDLDSLFADWTVANLLQDPSVGDGRYAYAGGGFHASVTGVANPEEPFLGALPDYAANYVDLPTGAGTVTFAGDPSVELLDARIDAGGVWWSNRGDSIDVRLSRQFDLTGVTEATLRFRAWYQVEDQFDFVYLSASRDDGQTWDVIPGQNTRPDDATGNNYGRGWTGSSDGWRDEEVDITPYAGGRVVLRFDYVTDQSYTGPGFAFKDVRIPQLGLDEAGAPETGWTAEGWVRVDGPVTQHWNLRVVRWSPTEVSVESVPVSADGTATFALDPRATRSTLVVAPTAPRTLLESAYSVTIQP